MSIIIGGDLAPTETNSALFEEAKIEELIDKKLLHVLEESDYRIFNLETPLSNQKKPILKEGRNLIASERCINGLVEMKCNLLSMANNHILDQGKEGLHSTMRLLKENGIFFVGAGQDLKDAQKPFYFRIKGKLYGVYACTEHEFSLALENRSGANPFDPLESFEHIATMSQNCDFVIVLYHGGKEHYRYPSPSLQRVCREMIEKGANLVVCQHSHCIGC